MEADAPPTSAKKEFRKVTHLFDRKNIQESACSKQYPSPPRQLPRLSCLEKSHIVRHACNRLRANDTARLSTAVSPDMSLLFAKRERFTGGEPSYR